MVFPEGGGVSNLCLDNVICCTSPSVILKHAVAAPLSYTIIGGDETMNFETEREAARSVSSCVYNPLNMKYFNFLKMYEQLFRLLMVKGSALFLHIMFSV